MQFYSRLLKSGFSAYIPFDVGLLVLKSGKIWNAFQTSWTSCNFFIICCVLQIHKDCGFFECVDPKMCAHGQRVVGRLVEWHESLVAETKRCETMVEVEVGKVKAEMEKEIEKVKAEVDNERNAEIAQYRKEIEIWGIKFEAVKKNYHTMLVCSWILFALCFFFGHAAKNQEDNRVGYLRLP